MGTRATIIVCNEDRTEVLVKLYKQFDGYLEGLGEQIYDILKNKKVVNGYTLEDEKAGYYNGIGCLAASLIKELKTTIGNVYVDSVFNNDNEYYTYCIYSKKDRDIYIAFLEDDIIKYNGLINEFKTYIDNYNYDDEDDDTKCEVLEYDENAKDDFSEE